MLVIHQLCCICIAYIVRCACTKQCETHCVLPQCWNDIEMREHRRCTFVLYINIILLIYIFYLDLGVFFLCVLCASHAVLLRLDASLNWSNSLRTQLDWGGFGGQCIRLTLMMHTVHTQRNNITEKPVRITNKKNKTKHTAAVATNTIDQPHYYKHTPKRNMAGLALYGGIARW